MPSFQQLERIFAAAWSSDAWRDSHVLLAVSAGPDSVALFRAALALKGEAGGRGRLYAAHLHHGLRGAESDADETWVQNLCDRWNVPLKIGQADIRQMAATEGDGLEAAARDARYSFLLKKAESLGARFVATGHTFDDQVETVLHRILRGTGLAGLAGMPESRPLSPSVTLVRPLLNARRKDVLDYLLAVDQDYRIDASNLDSHFTRNRLRHELLPLLRERYNSEVDLALMRLADQASETQQWIHVAASALAAQCVAVDRPASSLTAEAAEAPFIRLECDSLLGQPAVLIREVCKLVWQQANWPMQRMSFDHWQQLAAMASGNANMRAITLPANVRARRLNGVLLLEKHGLP